MADIFDWTGAPGARFDDDPASWFDATLDAPAQRAPEAGDSTIQGPGDWTATAGGQVGTLLIEDGARLTVLGTGTETLRATTLIEGVGSALLLQDALLSVDGTLTVGREAILDLSAAAANPIVFPPFGEVSVLALTLVLEGPGEGAGGGRVLLGDNTLEVGFLQNGNSGSGNDFDPGLGISGAGRVALGTIDVPNVIINDPAHGGFGTADQLTSLDFGTLHVGDAAGLRYALINLSGNAGTTAVGAVQTLVHGGNVTDPALSGSGVTAQDFTIAPRGGTAVYDVALDTTAAGVLQDQAVHIAFQFNRGSFDTGVTLPITGAVLHYADPGFVLASGPGSLVDEAAARWTLDLAAIRRGRIPGRSRWPSPTGPWRRPTTSAAISTSPARGSRFPGQIPSTASPPGTA